MPNRIPSLLHMSLKTLLLVSWMFTPLCAFIEKYIFNDWQFLIFLVILVTIDTLLGLVYHWLNQSLTSKGFSKIFIKFTIYCCFLTATHVLKYYTVNGVRNDIFSWVDTFCYSTIIIREFMSIMEGIARLNPDVIPKAIVKRFKAFDQKGNIIDTENN